MADRLDVVAVGIDDERAVVVRMIMRPEARLAVILAARGDRGLVKGVDIRSRFAAKGQVNPGFRCIPLENPEIGFSGDPEPPGLPLELVEQLVPERRQSLTEEFPAGFVVLDGVRDVIDHGLLSFLKVAYPFDPVVPLS